MLKKVFIGDISVKGFIDAGPDIVFGIPYDFSSQLILLMLLAGIDDHYCYPYKAGSADTSRKGDFSVRYEVEAEEHTKIQNHRSRQQI